MGIPSVSIIGTGFEKVAEMGYARLGYAELPLIVFPEVVLQGVIKDAQPTIQEKSDEIISGLTKWAPKLKGTGTIKPEPATLVYQGVDYQDALNRMNDDFLRRRWGDGLPLLPATKERVEWLLTGIDDPPDVVVSSVSPSGQLVTPRMVATSAAMAGARPEYMPVIMAGLKVTGGGVGQAGTNPAVFCLVVNGPIAKEIGINSTWLVLGPTSVYPACGAIGRALMTLGHTAGGASPGTTNTTTVGNPAAYNGYVFAEAEDRSPWEPLNVEHGFAKGTNTVMSLSVQGGTNLWLGGRKEFIGDFIRKELCRSISYPNWNFQQADGGVSVAFIIPPPAAQQLKLLGWSKQAFKEEIWKHHQVTLADWYEISTKDEGGKASPHFKDDWDVTLQQAPWVKDYQDRPPETMVPLAQSPKSYEVVVAGGVLTEHWRCMQTKMSGPAKIVEIKTPKNWADVLKQAPKFWEGAGF
jgi:hypothetical protein